jgi:hypothetical protein
MELGKEGICRLLIIPNMGAGAKATASCPSASLKSPETAVLKPETGGTAKRCEIE